MLSEFLEIFEVEGFVDGFMIHQSFVFSQ